MLTKAVCDDLGIKLIAYSPLVSFSKSHVPRASGLLSRITIPGCVMGHAYQGCCAGPGHADGQVQRSFPAKRSSGFTVSPDSARPAAAAGRDAGDLIFPGKDNVTGEKLRMEGFELPLLGLEQVP